MFRGGRFFAGHGVYQSYYRYQVKIIIKLKKQRYIWDLYILKSDKPILYSG